MPIQDRNALTPEERKLLLLALQEARSRGLPVPESAMTGRRVKWPIDSNGYFSKLNGRLFTPYENSQKFVKSGAFFSSLYGSRGCSKSASGSQKALRKIAQGYNGIVINPDFENLRISTWPEFREWIPWEMVVPNQTI